MNLNTITEVKRPSSADEIGEWRDGYAWLAGGTGCSRAASSHPHADRSRVAPLAALCRLRRRPGDRGDLHGRRARRTSTAPPNWTAAPLFQMCCRSFLASFKIWNEATVGGNICMSLPAGPMISLTAALEGVYTLWPAATPRRAKLRWSISSPATTRTSCSPANCCAASISPLRRSPSASPSGASRSRISGDRQSLVDRHADAPAADDLAAHHHRRHRPPGATPASTACRARRRTCARRSMPRCRSAVPRRRARVGRHYKRT